MRVIIAGGRDFNNYSLLEEEMDFLNDRLAHCITVVSGGAKGADALGELWGRENDLRVRVFPAKWDEYGKSAGYRRNVDMANHSEMLVAFWDGKSKGTKHMIDIALEKGLLVQVVRY
jgi:hypothetical protein